jgi:hypothetical protein
MYVVVLLLLLWWLLVVLLLVLLLLFVVVTVVLPLFLCFRFFSRVMKNVIVVTVISFIPNFDRIPRFFYEK